MSNVTLIENRNLSRVLSALRAGGLAGVLGLAVLFGQARPAEAALPTHPCTPELQQLLQAWNEAGFQAPNKPTQPIVYGRNGRVSSGPEVTYMIHQIRQAIRDCEHGDVASVQQRVAQVNEGLRRAS